MSVTAQTTLAELRAMSDGCPVGPRFIMTARSVESVVRSVRAEGYLVSTQDALNAANRVLERRDR